MVRMMIVSDVAKVMRGDVVTSQIFIHISIIYIPLFHMQVRE